MDRETASFARLARSDAMKPLLVLLVAALAAAACDPATTVRGRVVEAPSGRAAPTPVAHAVVKMQCEGLRPSEGLTTTTDANGSFEMSTIGGAFSDDCALKVFTERASTTIGQSKVGGDNPDGRLRQVEVALPAK
jgi:hypothetical protein